MPIFTPDASESILGAVLERLNSTGAACHEETIGDYASFINIQNNMSSLGDTPFYDYKYGDSPRNITYHSPLSRMIDTDLYVLPTVAHYLLDIPQGHNRANEFLSRTATLNNSNVNISYHDLLARNAAYILGRAVPFAQKPQASNLLQLRPGQPVGNWRDSNQGLGYGQIPFDVNSALVPAALRALQRLMQSGILTLQNQSDAGAQAGRYADVWEAHAAPLFDVKVNGATAESRWKDYIVRSNLSDALLGGGNGGKQNDVTFYALSLQDDGTPVDVSGPFFYL